jgi:hypothetical protein
MMGILWTWRAARAQVRGEAFLFELSGPPSLVSSFPKAAVATADANADAADSILASLQGRVRLYQYSRSNV